MSGIINNLIEFVINPNPNFKAESRKFELLYLLLFQYLLGVVFQGFDMLLEVLGVTVEFNSVPKPHGNSFYGALSVLGLWLLAPIKEELKYRFFLGRYHLPAIYLSCAILIADLILIAFFFIFSVKIEYEGENLHILTVILLGFLLYYSLSSFLPQKSKKIELFFQKKYTILLWFSAFIFAVWHIFLSSNIYDEHLLTLLLTYITHAVIFTYVRVNFGIYVAIFYHFLYNAPAYITLLVLLWFHIYSPWTDPTIYIEPNSYSADTNANQSVTGVNRIEYNADGQVTRITNQSYSGQWNVNGPDEVTYQLQQTTNILQTILNFLNRQWENQE